MYYRLIYFDCKLSDFLFENKLFQFQFRYQPKPHEKYMPFLQCISSFVKVLLIKTR